VQRLKAEEHYEVDEAKRTIAVTEEGIARVEQLLTIDNLYDQVHTPLVHYWSRRSRPRSSTSGPGLHRAEP